MGKFEIIQDLWGPIIEGGQGRPNNTQGRGLIPTICLLSALCNSAMHWTNCIVLHYFAQTAPMFGFNALYL